MAAGGILRTMRSSVPPVLCFGILLISCGPEPKPAATEPPKAAATPTPSDESRRFPKNNLIETKVIEHQLMGQSFMPGGTLGRYKLGTTEYEMFIAKLASPGDAALLLPDWRRALSAAKLVPSFGGYFGLDAGRPVFVFSKGAWIAGIAGLPERAADAEARVLAAQLN